MAWPADIDTLMEYYEYAVVTHAATAIAAKLSLGSAMLLVHQGLRNPGNRLLTTVLAVHFLMSGFLITGKGFPLTALWLITLALALLLGFYAATNKGEWRILPESNEALAWLTIAGLAAAFLFPAWPRLRLPMGALTSPMGAVPQQTLLVLLILLIVSGSRAPQPLVVGAATGALLMGILDVAVGNRVAGVAVLAVLGFGVMARVAPLLRGVTISDTGDVPAPPRKERKFSVKAPEKNEKNRKWEIK